MTERSPDLGHDPPHPAERRAPRPACPGRDVAPRARRRRPGPGPPQPGLLSSPASRSRSWGQPGCSTSMTQRGSASPAGPWSPPAWARTPAFARGLRALCDTTGAALILDDVRCGFRLHLGSSWEPVGVDPDLSAWSKAIANGRALPRCWATTRSAAGPGRCSSPARSGSPPCPWRSPSPPSARCGRRGRSITLAYAIKRRTTDSIPGEFTLGRWAWPVIGFVLAYTVLIMLVLSLPAPFHGADKVLGYGLAATSATSGSHCPLSAGSRRCRSAPT
jgi:Aminotransferase class-III